MADNNLPDPLFESEQGQFKVTLYNSCYIAPQKAVSDDEILKFCKSTKTREEIAKNFGISSVSYLVTTYLKPLVDKGKLNLTIPNAPRSKNQKYYTN